MSIQVNGNAGAVNWETLLGKIGEVTKTQGADGAAGTTNVTITTRADGVETPVTIRIPDDLEIPGEVDQAAIDSLCAKLAADSGLNLSDEEIAQFHEALTGALKELTEAAAAGNAKAGAAKNAMFDLYKLMALLVEVAQKQRDANRDMRRSESEAIQNSIVNQANAQRDAAITGMIAGAVCCLVQIGFTALALAKQAKAFDQQLGTDKTAGLDSARLKVDMLKTADNAQSAGAQLESVKAEVGNKLTSDGQTTVKTRVERVFDNQQFNESATNVANAKDAFQKNVQLTQTVQHLGSDAYVDQVTSDVIAPLEGPGIADIKTAVSKLEAYKADKAFYAEKTAPGAEMSPDDTFRMTELQEKYGENIGHLAMDDAVDPTLAQLKADVKTSFDNASTQLQQRHGQLLNEYETAKTNYRSQTKLEMQKFEDAYDNALRDFNDARKTGTKAEIADAKAKLETAGNELKYARAYGNAKLMASGATDSTAHLADVEAARANLAQVQTNRANSVDYIRASNTINNAQAVNGLIGAIGGFGQSLVQNWTQLKQSAATLEGAEQQKKQEELDQTKDLFNQAQSLVDSVVQLLQAIGAAESQSMRDAIQA